MLPNNLLQASVTDVKTWERDGLQFHAILLGARDGRLLAVNVGPGEAAAIALILTGTETSRPLTFPFVGALLTSAGIHLDRVIIDRLVDDVFTAKVEPSGGGAPVDARPSDALALALVVDAPILIAGEVLDIASFPNARQPRESLVGDAAEVARKAMDRYRAPGVPVEPAEEAGQDRQARSVLTRREEQVLRLVAAGNTNAEVSRTLGLSRYTVSRHLQNVYAKLGVSRRAQAVGYLRPAQHA